MAGALQNEKLLKGKRTNIKIKKKKINRAGVEGGHWGGRVRKKGGVSKCGWSFKRWLRLRFIFWMFFVLFF